MNFTCSNIPSPWKKYTKIHKQHQKGKNNLLVVCRNTKTTKFEFQAQWWKLFKWSLHLLNSLFHSASAIFLVLVFPNKRYKRQKPEKVRQKDRQIGKKIKNKTWKAKSLWRKKGKCHSCHPLFTFHGVPAS